MTRLRRQIHYLRTIQYHVTNIAEQPSKEFEWSTQKQKYVFENVCYFANVLSGKITFEEEGWKKKTGTASQNISRHLKISSIRQPRKITDRISCYI